MLIKKIPLDQESPQVDREASPPDQESTRVDRETIPLDQESTQVDREASSHHDAAQKKCPLRYFIRLTPTF